MPKVSVIIPVYGVEAYLREALDSVLKQTLKDLEIILIDDGGKDNCPQIIDEYAQKDNRIIAIHKKNGGYGAACNLGLEIATGEYIAIFEPDDYIGPKMYEDLYNIAQIYNSDIVKSGFYENIQSAELQKIKKVKWDDDKIPQNRSFTAKECSFFLYYHPSIWTCIYKKEFLDKHNIRFVEAPGAGWTDNPFQVQTMCLAERINYTTEAYYYWRRLNYNVSHDLKDYRIPFARCKDTYNWLRKNNISDPKILYNWVRRELSYVDIVLGMERIKNKNECSKLIKNMCIDLENIFDILNSRYLSEREKKKFLFFRHVPMVYVMNKRFKIKRKQIVSFRWNKKECSLVIAGKTLYSKKVKADGVY